MATPRTQLQQEYRDRVKEGIRCLKVPGDISLLELLHYKGGLDATGPLDWDHVEIAEVEAALQQYLEDQCAQAGF